MGKREKPRVSYEFWYDSEVRMSSLKLAENNEHVVTRHDVFN